MGTTSAIVEESRPRIAGVRELALAQHRPSDPNLVAAYWQEIGTPADLAHPDLTALYYSLRWLGQPYVFLEFVAGETLEELVRRSDPASCEREIPLFCRLLDSFEGAARNESAQPASQPDLELTDFGVARAVASQTTKLHGALLIAPDGSWREEIFGDYGASRSQVCALLMELCARLPGSLPRPSQFGPAKLDECAIRSLAAKVQPGKPVPAPTPPPVKANSLVRTVAPYAIAVVTAVLTLYTLHGVGGLLAKRSIAANPAKPLLPPAPAIEVSPPIAAPAPEVVTSVRPAPKKREQPIPSIVLARGARPIRQTSLQYPAEAKKEHVSGMVELQVTIAEDGSVQSPRVLSGDPLLQAGLAEEISKWVYQPLRVNGKPVPMTTELAIKFNLNP